MANMCYFEFVVVGDSKENIQAFLNAMQQEGTLYMGRGAAIFSRNEIQEEDGKFRFESAGECKWSLEAALILNAENTREEPEHWFFGDNIDSSTLEFITLPEASERFQVDVEMYSEELGCEFQEHKWLERGKYLVDDCVQYRECYLDEYDTKEEAEEDYGRTFSEEEWKEGQAYDGGFGEWKFHI